MCISFTLSHTARRESPRASQISPSPKNTINGRPPSYKGPVSPVSQHDTQPGNNNIILVILLFIVLFRTLFTQAIIYTQLTFEMMPRFKPFTIISIFIHSVLAFPPLSLVYYI